MSDSTLDAPQPSLDAPIPSTEPTDAGPDAPPSSRIRRKAPQLLADEIVAEERIAGAPSRNGGRLLTEDRDPWTHNAWDQVEWDDELEQFAVAAVERQRKDPVPQELQDKFNANPAAQWDQFYAHNKDNFFKERAWLQNEFPELEQVLKRDAGPKRVVEIGCGNGSTLFPLLASNENPQFRLHGYDYSKEAVNVVRAHASFNPTYLSCDVWDLSSPSGIPSDLEPNSVDIISMIFVFSALHPTEWEQAVKNVHTMLKPGGVLLFRDYGRNDLAQLRFKAGRYMQDGFSRVREWEKLIWCRCWADELVSIFGGVRSSAKPTEPTPTIDSITTTITTTSLIEETPSGATTPNVESSTEVKSAPIDSLSPPAPPATSANRLDLLQLGVDRRMILNRKRQLKMMRVWLQGRWKKREEESEETVETSV
ncbi:hypothetical protein JCM16303_000579 [Sporobolomyces ruberrimus]